MFGGSFNDLAFNSASEDAVNIVDMEARLSGEGRVLVDKFSMEMAATAHLSGDGRITAEYIREYSLEPERMSGEGRLSAAFIREIRHSARLSGEGRLRAEATKYHVDYIEFTDTFKPGDVIIIDSGKLKITRNGQNVSHLYEGGFFDLNLGTNNLTWTDPATGRTILFRITHRDKFLY
ncbi:phage tail family protein [Paenibacillus sp. Marseille-P2973]|uniref:phage distal tail protein n=1 Tax=Paenibacillus sp. Marseille-P2973 TaxID=1871032 RepID=UPI001B36C3E5|nr:phage tail domain-containing protein [Paenibacillus sp. Marseille-P2973]MBQ4899367.1 phage tail family protein [Paenibacillus sp. Marseille-P2973]